MIKDNPVDGGGFDLSRVSITTKDGMPLFDAEYGYYNITGGPAAGLVCSITVKPIGPVSAELRSQNFMAVAVQVSQDSGNSVTHHHYGDGSLVLLDGDVGLQINLTGPLKLLPPIMSTE